MATTFLEPGGDADFLVGTTNGFWLSNFGTTNVATDFTHGGHIKSIAYDTTSKSLVTPAATLADAGSRISIYMYFVALPSATDGIWMLRTSTGLSVVNLRITSGGILQLWNNGATAQIGTDGATLSTGVWYRISLAYTITSTTVNRFELFVDAVSSISVTNATLTRTGTNRFLIGNVDSDASISFRSSDHYIDNSNALTDPGNIWVTAKRPVSNGSTNDFTTQIGSSGSGYGTGHSPQVNERPLSAVNGWSISNTTSKTEEYTIEAKNVGDIDISGATMVDYTYWISAKVDSTADSPSHTLIFAGLNIAKTMSTTTTIFTRIRGASTYPTGNTDIGLSAQYTTNPHTTSLFECGVIVAYIPAPPTPPTYITYHPPWRS